MKLERKAPRSTILRGVNGHFLKPVHKPLKGQWHKKQIYIRIMLKKGYIFHFCTNVLG